MEIVTGSTGEVHVTPIDDAVRNGNTGYVSDRVVFNYYENFEARGITANEVRVFSGYGMNQGRLFKIDRNDYDSVTIENGSQGLKRADLIVARYTMNTQTGFEDISLAVIRGQSGSEYVDPSYTVGDINGGDTLDEFPLYRVKLDGIVMDGDPEPLFEVLPDGGRLGVVEKRLDGEMLTDLESESRGKLDGSENVDIGIKGVLPVSHGGTGKNSNTQNAIIVGNDNSPVKNIASANGALYATGANAEPQFGTLPIGQGGTGQTSNPSMITNLGTTNADAVFKANPRPGVTGILPAANGGTGQTSLQAARNAMGLGNTLNQLPVANGGTGLTESPSMITNLGTSNADDVLKASPRPGVTGTLGIGNGGTGASSASAARASLGLGNVNNTSDADKPVSTATQTALNGKAPTNHASADATYGKGTASNFGHVKLSDSYNPTTPSAAADGVAASQKAVKDAYQAALDAMGRQGYGDMMKDTYDPNKDGIIGIAQGGTNASTIEQARTNLGLGSVATENIVPVSKGGTGKSSWTSNKLLVGNGTSAPTEKSYQEIRNSMGLGNTTGALPVANGGTGATTAANARTNLGLGSVATENVLPLSKGGTGASNLPSVKTNLGIPIRTLLYESNSRDDLFDGTSSVDVTLNDAWTNYDVIEIFVRDLDSNQDYYRSQSFAVDLNSCTTWVNVSFNKSGQVYYKDSQGNFDKLRTSNYTRRFGFGKGAEVYFTKMTVFPCWGTSFDITSNYSINRINEYDGSALLVPYKVYGIKYQ